LPSTAAAIASATSPTKAGWNRVSPPPTSGSAGENRAMPAKRLKKSSSGPNRIEGRKMVAEGTAASTAFSPSALVRA
jgi:hypothetical protein